MKTLKEILGDELFAQVNEKLTSEPDTVVLVDNKKTPSFIPKDRFDEVNSQKNEYKTQVSTMNTQLETLKTELSGNAKALEQVETLKNQIKDADSKVKSIKVDSEVKIALMAMKAKKPQIVEKLLDRSKLELTEDGQIKGLNEQLEALKQSDAYLFDVVSEPNPSDPPGNPAPAGQNNPPQDPPVGGTGNPGNPSPQGTHNPPQSIGARLAARQAEMMKQSTSNNFFKTE